MSDIYAGSKRRAQERLRLETKDVHHDYLELIQRADSDAVVEVTPEHCVNESFDRGWRDNHLPNAPVHEDARRRGLSFTRRGFLLMATAPAGSAVRLLIGNYGMQTLEVDRMLAVIGEIGYDGAELCLLPGCPSEPAKLDPAARRRIRQQPLPIPTLLDNLNLLAPDAEHARNLDRIRAGAALAHDLAPKNPPLMQTALGGTLHTGLPNTSGTPGNWEQVKQQMAVRLAEWARVAHENKLKLAVKSHFGSPSDTPEKLIWLLDQVRSPALTAVYDYAHFQLLGLDLAATLDALLSRSAFITVKDSRLLDGNKAQFLLPGDGTVDYGFYFGRLKARNYRGWMLAEISRQLSSAPGYDPIAAARKCYGYLAPRLRSSGLRA